VFPVSEVIVVDSSNSPSCKDRVREIVPLKGARLIDLVNRSGLPMQRNVGIDSIQTKPDVVCFFDDDVVLDSQYVENVISKFTSDDSNRIVGICGNAMNERGRNLIDRLVRNIFLVTDNHSGKLLVSGDAGHIFSPRDDTEVSVLSGCNMCFRGQILFVQNVRFDELLNGYAYMEDQDFSHRARKFGRLVQLKEARLIHKSTLAGKPDMQMLFQMYVVNSYYLLKKNLDPELINYVCYGWRLVGKFVHALASSCKARSSASLVGYFSGLVRINDLAGKLKGRSPG
jgi:GT2 family glycosyltransferase